MEPLGVYSTVYVDEGVELYQGDAVYVLPHVMGDRQADLVLTDLPYAARTRRGARRLGQHGPEDQGIDFAFTEEDAVAAVSAMAPYASRWVVVFMDWTHANAVRRFVPPELEFVRLGCWVKTNSAPQFTGDRPGMGWEAIAILHRRGVPKRWNSGGHRSSWIHPVAQKREGKDTPRRNPTEKPVGLLGELIGDFADRGGLVLDPFCGTGATLVAAKGRAHPSVGLDVSPAEVGDARGRVRQEVLPYHAPAEQLELSGGGQ